MGAVVGKRGRGGVAEGDDLLVHGVGADECEFGARWAVQLRRGGLVPLVVIVVVVVGGFAALEHVAEPHCGWRVRCRVWCR